MTRFGKGLILSGWILLWLLTVGLFAAYAWLEAIGVHREALESWCGMAAGFTFASFPLMVRDFLKLPES
jgi:hypothetical protein